MNSNYSIKDWEESLENSSLPAKERAEKLFYVRKAYENNVPVILDLEHFSGLLGLKAGVFTNMIRKPASFYRTFTIPKRKGGLREIVTPQASLLKVQQWICENILSTFEIHNAAYAYVAKRNVAQNALLHMGCDEMLKIDLKDFFPSINIKRVRELYNRLGYSKEIAGYLSYLTCLNGTIPQGAGSSPMISNIILQNLDKRLNNFAQNQGVVYSRYADDLIFSGEQIPLNFKAIVIQNINSEGFTVNNEKVKEYSINHRKLVTGILVKKDEIRLQKSKRREIKEQVHYIEKFGILDQISRYNDIYYIDRILGRLGYWKQIEPNNEFVKYHLKKIKTMYYEVLNKKNETI